MKVKFFEGSKLKWTKKFLSESNADKFISMMEKIIKPSITIESELYVNQRIPMNSISDIATENLFVKKLEESFKKGINRNVLLENGIPSSIHRLSEELVVQTSLDTATREYMFDLFSRIVCARDYAHLLHLNADSGGQHLMLEKIYEILDDMVDDCGEKYFMARNIKIPNPLAKNEIYAAGDLGDLLAEMSALCENICKDPNLDESIKSMVSGFGEDFQRSMGFWRQAQMDNPNKMNESVYIKRVKDGANKYFCNLNGSPAWGPKDLAIQFKDEVEAKKFLKKYDYLLSKNKITIVNESISKRKPKLSESKKVRKLYKKINESQNTEEQCIKFVKEHSDWEYQPYGRIVKYFHDNFISINYCGKPYNEGPKGSNWDIELWSEGEDDASQIKYAKTLEEAVVIANKMIAENHKPSDNVMKQYCNQHDKWYFIDDYMAYFPCDDNSWSDNESDENYMIEIRYIDSDDSSESNYYAKEVKKPWVVKKCIEEGRESWRDETGKERIMPYWTCGDVNSSDSFATFEEAIDFANSLIQKEESKKVKKPSVNLDEVAERLMLSLKMSFGSSIKDFGFGFEGKFEVDKDENGNPEISIRDLGEWEVSDYDRATHDEEELQDWDWEVPTEKTKNIVKHCVKLIENKYDVEISVDFGEKNWTTFTIYVDK